MGKETTDGQGSAQQIRSRSQHPSRILAYYDLDCFCLGSRTTHKTTPGRQAKQAVVGRRALGVARRGSLMPALQREKSSTSHYLRQSRRTAQMAKPRAGMVDPGHSLPRLFTSHSAAQLCFTLSRLPVLSHEDNAPPSGLLLCPFCSGSCASFRLMLPVKLRFSVLGPGSTYPDVNGVNREADGV